ncbi:hypothetical protein J7J84_07615 [bacterium]|nr:hypothetical protein [bacterium]
MGKKLATLALIAGILLAFGAHALADLDTGTADEDAYVQVSLAAIARWERLLYSGSAKLNEVDTNSLVLSLLEDLTRLYEATKLPAAREHILRLLQACEMSTRYGFSGDGTLAASIVRLELKRPEFRDYSVFLLNVENRSGVDLRIQDWRFTIATKDGATIKPDALTESHPLHTHLARALAGFGPPEMLKAGSTASFKLVFAGSGLAPSAMKYFRVDLDEMRIVVKFYENLN